jgi:hypothetical protein
MCGDTAQRAGNNARLAFAEKEPGRDYHKRLALDETDQEVTFADVVAKEGSPNYFGDQVDKIKERRGVKK